MYDDIAEFKRFYQTRLGQNVADLMWRQLDLFWPAGSLLSSAFLGSAQPFLDSNQPIRLGLCQRAVVRRLGQNHHRFAIALSIR